MSMEITPILISVFSLGFVLGGLFAIVVLAVLARRMGCMGRRPN